MTKEGRMLNILISWFAWFGLFCFFMAIGGAVLFAKYLLDWRKEDKQRRQEQAKIKAMKEAEDIIYQLL